MRAGGSGHGKAGRHHMVGLGKIGLMVESLVCRSYRDTEERPVAMNWRRCLLCRRWSRMSVIGSCPQSPSLVSQGVCGVAALRPRTLPCCRARGPAVFKVQIRKAATEEICRDRLLTTFQVGPEVSCWNLRGWQTRLAGMDETPLPTAPAVSPTVRNPLITLNRLIHPQRRLLFPDQDWSSWTFAEERSKISTETYIQDRTIADRHPPRGNNGSPLGRTGNTARMCVPEACSTWTTLPIHLPAGHPPPTGYPIPPSPTPQSFYDQSFRPSSTTKVPSGNAPSHVPCFPIFRNQTGPLTKHPGPPRTQGTTIPTTPVSLPALPSSSSIVHLEFNVPS